MGGELTYLFFLLFGWGGAHGSEGGSGNDETVGGELLLFGWVGGWVGGWEVRRDVLDSWVGG